MTRRLYALRRVNTFFLISTFLTTILAVPAYIWRFGLEGFQIALFLIFFIATGLSITLGYHRLFSHLSFHAKWPVKLFTLLFGAAAFEGSALGWAADHRRHHKFVDHEDDPYDISRGLFHAHIGWLLFRTGPDTPLTWVRDLQKDRLAWWQHRYYVPIALLMGFGAPTLAGFLLGGAQGALGAFLIAGVARIVLVHHMTFCINSLCHWIGSRPYSSKCTARDSFLMALFTFGEGYHNFHHEFQHDYRNGVKPWQFDPTKWTIWLLSRLGLTAKLRTVPEEKILKAQIAERQLLLSERLAGSQPPAPLAALLHNAQERMHQALTQWEDLLKEYRNAHARKETVRRRELRNELKESAVRLRHVMRDWMDVHHSILEKLSAPA